MVILIHRFWLKIKRIMDEGKFNKYENLNIGENTQYSNDNLDGIAPQLISIGRDCIFAPKSVVLTHDASLVPTTGKYLFSPVVIGDRVFVGYGAVIMPGVKIGNNVVIGSNCVITKDVPDGVVVVGVPAKIISKTKDLEEKRAAFLQEAIFDWKKAPCYQDIIEQQKVLIMQFKENNTWKFSSNK